MSFLTFEGQITDIHKKQSCKKMQRFIQEAFLIFAMIIAPPKNEQGHTKRPKKHQKSAHRITKKSH